MDERLVAVEQAVPTGEQVAFEPALALVFAQHLHDPALAGEEFVAVLDAGVPLSIGGLEHRAETVGQGLVRAKDAEVALRLVEPDHIAQEHAEFMGIGRCHRAG